MYFISFGAILPCIILIHGESFSFELTFFVQVYEKKNKVLNYNAYVRNKFHSYFPFKFEKLILNTKQANNENDFFPEVIFCNSDGGSLVDVNRVVASNS